MIDYKAAGVDIEKGDQFVEKIKAKVASQYSNRVYSGIGGFAALYQITEDKLIAAGTDGVGTKIKTAQQLNIHNTVGIDLVAMCVNDILCVGATPLFFMDYLGVGKLVLAISESIIEGIQEGCIQSSIPLIGGETAEMPSVYPKNEYDLAGFAIGEVLKSDVIDGKNISENHAIVALPSSGLHSNGFSLARKLVQAHETELLQEMLTPTRIYTKAIKPLLQKHRKSIHGLSHITGGGIDNIARLNSDFDYKLEQLPEYDSISPIFSVMKERSKLSDLELYHTFNMGIGFCIITDNPDLICSELTAMGEKPMVIGSITSGSGKVIF